ncbi:MAG: glycosyltransferase [Bacteroidota bacterium]|jgi:glycosyltransferase involved in cell wall biosynthesis
MRSDISYHFLFFGLTSFSSLPQREQAIAVECARLGHTVDFIEIAPSVAGKVHAMFNRVFAPLARDTGFSYDASIPNLRIHTPPTLPTGFRNSLTPGIDRRIFRRWFRTTFREVDFSQVIAMVMMPLWWDNFIDRDLFDPRLLVYDICDSLEVQSRDDETLRRLHSSEAALGADADLITYSAAEMERDVRGKFPNTDALFLPNAVSRDFIMKIDREPLVQHHGRPPSIGYIGATSGKWFDSELVIATIRECQDCHVSIIGPVDKHFTDACAQYSNVTLHGYIKHDALASHLRSFDVAIIPFLDNEITRLVNPLKLYEYSAAGLPIVARWTAELAHHSQQVYLARDSVGFIASIRAALEEDSPELRQARRRFAEEHTWGDRVNCLIGHFHEPVLAA